MDIIERFDIVSIVTTRNVKWMSDRAGSIPDPNGIWTVVCTFPLEGQVLVAKDTAMAKIPIVDIVKVASYNLEDVFQKLETIK